VGISSTSPGYASWIALTSSSPGGTQTAQPGAVVTKNELSRGKSVSGGFRDEISFGINLGDVVPAAAGLSPWASAGLNLGYWNTTPILSGGSRLTTSTGYGFSYEERDALTGTRNSTSFSADTVAGEFDLGFALSGGISLKINDIFSFSPDLGYGIEFPIYGNRYTDVGGDEAVARGAAATQYGQVFQHLGYYNAPNPQDSGPITEKTDQWNVTVYELSRVEQNLAPGFKLAAEFGALSFALKYTPEFNFYNAGQTTKRSNKAVTTHKEGADAWNSYTTTTTVSYEDQTVEYSGVTWDNTIAIGAQVWLKADKLRLNLGSRFTNRLGDWQTTKTTGNNRTVTTTTTEYDDENHQGTSQTTVNSPITTTSGQTFSQTAQIVPVQYNLGFTFFLNENINFDFLMKSQEDRGENWLELLLPATWALQFNIRY
jgi:hypothetical protein